MTPAIVRAMSPEETSTLIAGWNAAQQGDEPEAPTRAQLDELIEKHG